MSKDKPSVFIASSIEGLEVADAINLNLDHDTFPTLWRTGTFRLGSTAIDDLVKKSSTVDFAIFVFTPDDAATIRDEATRVVRDNVLFELGLFVGALGKERCYVVRPRGVDMHLPSDLLRVIHAAYATDRPDGEITAALNAACKQIRDEIARHGPIQRHANSPSGGARRHVANPPAYSLTFPDFLFLGECVASHTSYPQGLTYYQIENALNKLSSNAIRISATKLLRLGYVDKTVEIDHRDGEPYYSYSITENGLDVYLSSEEIYRSEATPAKRKESAKPSRDLEDDVPF